MNRARHTARSAGLGAILAAALVGIVWATVPVPSSDDWTPPDEIELDPTALAVDDELRDHLGGIDYVPERTTLDAIMGDAPASDLIAIATADVTVDAGVRLRALRALALYPEAASRGALASTIAQLRGSKAGVDLLYLDAAMMSLAVIDGDNAIDIIRTALDHGSKDARAAAARALGATGSENAKPWLYERLGVETDDMVRFALSDAIRALDEKQL